MKRRSPLLITRGMYTKTTLKYHLIPIRMAMKRDKRWQWVDIRVKGSFSPQTHKRHMHMWNNPHGKLTGNFQNA